LRRPDGRCIFQFNRNYRLVCALQPEKPYACKIWPFIVSRNPAHGRDDAARWELPHGRAYIYVNPRCFRIRYGKPTAYMIGNVLPEVVEIALGEKQSQLHTISNARHIRVLETISSGARIDLLSPSHDPSSQLQHPRLRVLSD
jgi:hypothetical protein